VLYVSRVIIIIIIMRVLFKTHCARGGVIFVVAHESDRIISFAQKRVEIRVQTPRYRNGLVLFFQRLSYARYACQNELRKFRLSRAVVFFRLQNAFGRFRATIIVREKTH